jgi:cell division protein FtsZ
LSEAGEGTDVILGLGYDNSLEDKIGITLIATGFEHKDPFKADKKSEQVTTPKKDEKIILTLGAEPAAMQATPSPEMVVEPVKEAPVYEEPIREELAPTMTEVLPKFSPLELFTMDDYRNNTVDNPVEKSVEEERTDWVLSQPSAPFETPVNNSITDNHIVTNSPSSAASGGYLAKPSNIYAEPSSSKEQSPKPLVNEPASLNKTMSSDKEEDPSAEIKLVIKEEVPVADESWAHQTQENVKAINSIEEPAMQDEVEIQKRKAAERIQKLRNLSFNINSADPNNEFETVPAYIRRNLELNNNSSHVESFYSNYEVKADNNNSAQISTINTFLDGKKPD